MHPFPISSSRAAHGQAVVRAAFVLALFGWGVGFYGPPVFLHAVIARTGWPLPLVSAAVTFHFLFGAAVVAGLSSIHRRVGIPAASMAVGLATVSMALSIASRELAATPDGEAPVVARCVALAQALYALAPFTLAFLLVDNGQAAASLGKGNGACFFAIAALQGLAIVCMLWGRRGIAHPTP